VLYLFDLDGTLMTSDSSGKRAFERACRIVLGVESALATITLHGNTDPLILDEACRASLGRPPSATETRDVLKSYLDFLADELARPNVVSVLPGVESALASLESRGAWIGLATGNVADGARLKLTAAGLWHRFRFGGFGDDDAERAGLVRVAIRRAEALAGRPLPQVTVIGDTPRDVAAAKAVGARAVAVATGMHSVDALRAAGADEVHETLATFAA